MKRPRSIDASAPYQAEVYASTEKHRRIHDVDSRIPADTEFYFKDLSYTLELRAGWLGSVCVASQIERKALT